MSSYAKKRMRYFRAGYSRQGLKRYARRTTKARFRPLSRMKAVSRFTQARFRNARTGGFLGQELKFYDTSLVSGTLLAPTDAAGGEHDPSATVVLNSVVQGDGEQQRDGRKITMKSLYMNGIIQIAPQASQSSGDSATIIFIAVVLDTQTNGATIVSELVYTNESASAILAAAPMRNLQQADRFRVLAVKKFTMQNPNIANDTGSTGGIVTNGLTRPFKMYVKLGNMVVTYKGTTETVANITDNSLHVIAYCSNAALVPKISYNARLRFMG